MFSRNTNDARTAKENAAGIRRICKAPAKRSQHVNATYRNIVVHLSIKQLHTELKDLLVPTDSMSARRKNKATKTNFILYRVCIGTLKTGKNDKNSYKD